MEGREAADSASNAVPGIAEQNHVAGMPPDCPSSDEDNGFFECPAPPHVLLSAEQNGHLPFPPIINQPRKQQTQSGCSSGRDVTLDGEHEKCQCPSQVSMGNDRRGGRDSQCGRCQLYTGSRHGRGDRRQDDDDDSDDGVDFWMSRCQENGRASCDNTMYANECHGNSHETGDDMDSYLNENAHLLSELDIQGANPSRLVDHSNPSHVRSVLSDHTDMGDMFLGNDHEAVDFDRWADNSNVKRPDLDLFHQPRRLSPNHVENIEDHDGDFIEADFSRSNHRTFLGFDDSKESSYEDLSNMDCEWSVCNSTNAGCETEFSTDPATVSTNYSEGAQRMKSCCKNNSHCVQTDKGNEQNNLDLKLFMSANNCHQHNCTYSRQISQGDKPGITVYDTSPTNDTLTAVTPDSSAYVSPDADYFDFESELDSGPDLHSDDQRVDEGRELQNRDDLNIRTSETNDLNEVFSLDVLNSDQEEELRNVSRQTSTSNFDQDENSFQDNLGAAFSYELENENAGCKPSMDEEADQIENHRVLDRMGSSTCSNSTDPGEEMAYHNPRAVLPQQPSLHSIAPLLDYVNSASDENDEIENQRPEIGIENGGTVDCETCCARPECSQDLCNHQEHRSSPDQVIEPWIVNLIRERRCGPTVTPSKNQVDKVMIWSEYEAYVLQVKQIGTSACGPTAVINILKAFEIFPEKEEVCEVVKTQLRAEHADVGEYLISRSKAGTTAQDLMEGVERLTDGDIGGRFFCFYPQRDVNLRLWLGHWMKKGVVALATLNMQKGVPPAWTIPDAWHHQMIYGVGPKGIYLTNPLEVVPEDIILQQLCSASELLVRRNDVIQRWGETCDLRILLGQEDERWRQMNVIGQVINVLRENNTVRVPGYRPQLVTHVRIPAVYKAGITLFAKKNTQVYTELMNAPELPIKPQSSSHQTR